MIMIGNFFQYLHSFYSIQFRFPLTMQELSTLIKKLKKKNTKIKEKQEKIT